MSACGPQLEAAPQLPSPEPELSSAPVSGDLFDAVSEVMGGEDGRDVGAYYCDPYYQDPYCDCPYYDPYCEGLPPPPPPPPSAPRYMKYTPFSESSLVSVSWRASSSYDVTHYDLERQENGGSWVRIYSGAALSAGGGIYQQGEYAFRVRACNTGGCSAYLTDPKMRFSAGPVRTPTGFLKSTSEDFLAALGFETPPTLGLGYDHLRQELTKNTCITGGPSSTMDARSKNFRLEIAYSRNELSTLLNLTQNLGVSAKYGKVSGSYSGRKELLSTSTRVEETTMVVASLRDQFRVESLQNPGLMSLSSTFVDQLQTGQQARFRNLCGDSFVHSIAHGRQFYVTFQLKSFNHTQEEIRTQTNSLKIDIGGYVSANYDSTKKTQITQKYSGYSVQAHVISFGSSVGVSGVVTLDTALQFMKDFEAEPVSNGSYPIDFNTDDYDVPAGVTSYPHYAPYKSTLQRWYSFDQQLARRCEMFDDDLYPNPALYMTEEALSTGVAGGLNLRDACFMIKRAVGENIQNCEDTTKWGQCIQPDSGACIVPGTSESCLAFANRLPAWTAVTSSLLLYADLGSGPDSESKTARGTACLSGQQIRDQRIKAVDCAGQSGCPAPREGVTVKTLKLHRASNGYNTWSSSNRCLSAQVTITRPGWWQSGAGVNQTQTVNGLNPQILNYLF